MENLLDEYQPTAKSPGIKSVSDAAARYISSAFVPCDVPLASASPSESLLDLHPPFRGAPILKPSLSSWNSSHSSDQVVTVVRSRVFPDSVSWVRFFSAAATLDLAAIKKLHAAETVAGAASSPLVCRHERLFRHPVSSGCIAQSGMQLKINNKKATLATKKNAAPWHLYFGARWKEEELFAAEMARARGSGGVVSVRVNAFPGSFLITRKDNLAIQMQKMRLKFPKDFDFTPSAYVLPRDSALFTAELSRCKSDGAPAVFIAKPPASSQGRGVFLFRADAVPAQVATKMAPTQQQQQLPSPAPIQKASTRAKPTSSKKKQVASKKKKRPSGSDSAASSELSSTADDDNDEDDRDEEVEDEMDDDQEENDDDGLLLVQRYIDKPLTIHGFKVDLRIYVLVTSFDPLKIFIFNDGLVRFATVPLHKEEGGDGKQQQPGVVAPLSELCAHLTNVSVNSKAAASASAASSSSYSKTDRPEQDGTAEGSKWTLHALKRHVISTFDAATWDRCWAGLCRTVSKVFISIQDDLASRVSTVVQNRNSCFELFGFDVLLDESLQRSYVLEVNYLPSLVCGSALDRHIKGHMIADMLSLVGVSTSSSSSSTSSAMIDGPILSAAAIRRRNSAPVSDSDFQQRLDIIISKLVAPAGKREGVNVAALKKRFMETVVDEADRGIVSYAEEELTRRGGWERVFPTADSVRELRHLFPAASQRRGNRVLWAFETLKSLGAFGKEAEVEELLSWMRCENAAPLPTPPLPAAPAEPAKKSAAPVVPTPVKKKPVVAGLPRVASLAAAAKQQPVAPPPPPAAAVAVASAGAAPLSCQLFSFQQIPTGSRK